MKNDLDLDILKSVTPPTPSSDAREQAMRAALAAYDQEKKFTRSQGSPAGSRLMAILNRSWSNMMTTMTKGRLLSGTAIAGILVAPVAGFLALALLNSEYGKDTFAPEPAREMAQDAGRAQDPVTLSAASPAPAEAKSRARNEIAAAQPPAAELYAAPGMLAKRTLDATGGPSMQGFAEGLRADRFEHYVSNGIRSVLQDPVSTFSIDVDTASYAYARRALMEGHMPDADSVRVEEMINYFPYAYPLPENPDAPFGVNVSVVQTPWNADTKLMHIGIQGYDVVPGTRPAANMVFLIDVSGSMDAPDKLPLLKSAFRLLLDKLDERDTISIVTYAGEAGTVLEPTKASERDKILEAIDDLKPGGTTAGAAGIEEAYKLARKAMIKGGVNRVMLATDGDFNVGPSSDEELKRMVEERRDDGIFLSVFGFGKGNYNDQLMQTLAQNGNGTAAYIDTLAEAQKTLVEEAGSTLFPIAKDVKIQVEFNPETVAEYRLIGYETRALNNSDFNNDRVDAGDIGSGHSVTAIYEIVPVGSSAVLNDPLRYGAAEKPAPSQASGSGEYAFVKLRYKLPDEDTSKLITTPVGAAQEKDMASASDDTRFSIAVAAFGQKLRDEDAVAGYGWDAIRDLASGARGEDPYGYRSEFIRMTTLAKSLDR